VTVSKSLMASFAPTDDLRLNYDGVVHCAVPNRPGALSAPIKRLAATAARRFLICGARSNDPNTLSSPAIRRAGRDPPDV
jgi:hypothetical protein